MKDILLLQLNRLGDLVQTMPLMRRMRTDHPDARIVLVAQEGFSAILGECDYFDTLITLTLGQVEALGAPEQQAAFPNLAPFDSHPEFSRTYDLIVNLTNDLGSAVLCRKIGAARKLGRVDTYEGEIRLLGPWAKYMFSLVSNRMDNPFNIVDIQMGIAGKAPRPEPCSLRVTEARRREAREFLAAAGRRPERKLVALQTAASELHRAWSLENFSVLAQSLLAPGDVDILLVGDARERERTERLAGLIGMPVINAAGMTSLLQLPALLQACDLLISNDTGTIHVGAAAGTPTLGLYFSSAYYPETAPYGENHAVLQVEIPCSPCQTSSRCAVQTCREYLTPAAVHETAAWMLGTRPEIPLARPNLSLYASRFLANGTLAYVPVRPEGPSEHFMSGLLGRFLWDGALGLRPDPLMEAYRMRLCASEAWNRKKDGLMEALAGMRLSFRVGLDRAESLRAEFAAGSPRRERIMELHESLARLGKAMAEESKGAGICGTFLKFEMMDMDFATYPVLADILAGKYRSLTEWIGRFDSALARLSAPALSV
jgi:ADP-heptose:LPS heptosyltransferase